MTWSAAGVMTYSTSDPANPQTINDPSLSIQGGSLTVTNGNLTLVNASGSIIGQTSGDGTLIVLGGSLDWSGMVAIANGWPTTKGNITLSGGTCAFHTRSGVLSLGRQGGLATVNIFGGILSVDQGANPSLSVYLGGDDANNIGYSIVTMGPGNGIYRQAAGTLVFRSGSYFNFWPGSLGQIQIAGLVSADFQTLVNNGQIRLNGATVNYTNFVYSTSGGYGILSLKPVFVHPGISHTLADLNRMKNNTNTEPYKTAFINFANMGYSSYNNTGQGPFGYETIGHGQFEIRNDAQVCHQNAIMWCVTGNTNYLTNAISLMMRWANTLTNFDITDHLTAGTCIQDFCDAGEIIRATGNGIWLGNDIATFQNWMLTYLYPPLLTPGGSIQANNLEAAGHGGLQIAGLFSLGIFCDRADIYSFGVSSLLHNGTYTYGFTEYIDVNSAQNYESQRDIGHASGNVNTFLESFYKVYNQGQDLFSLSNNLLARAFEIQAKFDLGWDVAPVTWTAKDGTVHVKMCGDNRNPPFDNLDSDLAYYIYHDLKGLNMPYTKMSSQAKFPNCYLGGSFYHLVDSSGKVPTPPLIGEPAVTGVRIYEDYLTGSYPLTSFQPGNYNHAALVAGGMGANGSGGVSSIRVPTGWFVQLYNADNFTGSSIMLTGTVANANCFNLTNFNDQLVSMKVTSGGTYVIFNGTYRLVSRNSAKPVEVVGSSTADGALVDQRTYNSGVNQLWRIESMGGAIYKIQNLNSDKVMEVAGASLGDGASVDQSTYIISNLATGGTATASPNNSGPGGEPFQAFDGNSASKWYNNVLGGVGYLQYQLAAAKVVNQYQLISANDVQERDPATWQFQGSNNGSTWVTLNTQSGQVFAARFQANTYSFTNTTAYLYYRLNVTANYGGSSYGIQLAELGLYNTLTSLHQRWNISAATGSAYGAYFKVLNANSGKALDVSGGSTADGASIIQWPDGGGLNQQWMLQNP